MIKGRWPKRSACTRPLSRAVASKYRTPPGVFELRYFFSGRSGTLRRRDAFDPEAQSKDDRREKTATHPLTDDQITSLLQGQGIDVTRRTVAKYREDMKIPSTHQRERGNNRRLDERPGFAMGGP
jgi:RNA polymerase sigma-54 factor